MPLAGIIIGIVFLTRDDQESKGVGKICLICAIASIVVGCLCYVGVWVIYFGMMSRAVPIPPTVRPPG